MKKYFLTMTVMALFAIGFAASDEDESTNGSSSSSEQTELEQKPSFLGTYEVTDKVGQTMLLTLNADETGTATIKGESVTYYCSWRDDSDIGRGLLIDFPSGVGERPNLVYEGGTDEFGTVGCYLKDGWFYSGSDNVKSNNPRWRLKATKIK